MEPLSGSTILTILLSGISASDAGKLSCKFGNKTVAASIVNMGELKCVTPSSDFPDTVLVSILRHGEDVTRQRLNLHTEKIVQC